MVPVDCWHCPFVVRNSADPDALTLAFWAFFFSSQLKKRVTLFTVLLLRPLPGPFGAVKLPKELALTPARPSTTPETDSSEVQERSRELRTPRSQSKRIKGISDIENNAYHVPPLSCHPNPT